MEATTDRVRCAPVFGRGLYLAFGIKEMAMPAHSCFTRILQLVLATGCVLLMIRVAYAAECHMTRAFATWWQRERWRHGGVV
jgi:hypothetical protein